MSNIIWLASYPKSGNTWMRIFIENYLQNSSSAIDINEIHRISVAESSAHRYQPYLPEGKETTDLSAPEICAIRPSVQADIARSRQTTSFVKTHNFLGDFEGFPLHNMDVSCGAIYILRNPLDVTISLSKYFGYSIDDTIEYMADEKIGTPNEKENVPQIITSWSLHVQSWTSRMDDSCLVLRYEDMLDHSKKAFRAVEKFLGMSKNPKRLKNAIKNASFQQLKAQEKKHGFVEKHENAQSFFRQGRKNQWQQLLSESQVQKIVSLNKIQMERFGYLPR